jgi:hypothetical protein
VVGCSMMVGRDSGRQKGTMVGSAGREEVGGRRGGWCQHKLVFYPVYRRRRLGYTVPPVQGLLGRKRLATVNLLAF